MKMKLDDLKLNWQQQVNTPATTENLTEVIAMLEKETTKIDKEIRRRDMLEITIAILLIPFWLWGLYNSVSSLQTVGLCLAISTSIYIPYKLVSAKKVAPVKNNNVKTFLETERLKVQQQKQLLESIVWWYIAPITVSIVLITLGSRVNDAGIPQINEQLGYYYGFLTLLIVGIYLLNKQAAKKKFEPLLKNIEQRLAELK